VSDVAQFDRKARLQKQAVEQQREKAEKALMDARAEFVTLKQMERRP